MIDFDKILDNFGKNGKYQVFLIVMIQYSSLISGWSGLAAIFIHFIPEYRCNASPLDTNHNLTEVEILNLTTPFDEDTGEYNTCYRYNYNLSSCVGDLSCVNKSAGEIQCDQGYHYDDSVYTRSIITEFDLVCDRSFYDPLSLSFYMLGYLIASMTLANAPDRWGRKPIITFSIVNVCIVYIASTFVLNYWLMVCIRFFAGFFAYGIFLGNFIYVVEICNDKWRTVVGLTYQITYAFGYMILSGLGYKWRDYHELFFVMGILSIPYVLFQLILPESPRWLFATGKDEEGKRVTRKFAKYNGFELDEPEIWNKCQIDDPKLNDDGSFKKYTFIDLFRTKRMAIISTILVYDWFVVSLVYYGISLNAGALYGNIFANNAINGCMEIGSFLFVILLMDRTGRKAMFIFLICLSGISILGSVTAVELSNGNQAVDVLSVVLAWICKLGISGAYGTLYTITSELYPTVFWYYIQDVTSVLLHYLMIGSVPSWSTGMGLCALMEGISGVLLPFILAIQNYIDWLPNVLFGILAIIGVFLSTYFPETQHNAMMETLEEAELFYAGKLDKTKRFNHNYGDSMKENMSYTVTDVETKL